MAALMAAYCASPSESASAQAVATQDDSAAIVQAVWRMVARPHGPPGNRLVLWLWAPEHGDSLRRVALSPQLLRALLQRGLPAYPDRPAGDDTVVFRLTDWKVDRAGVLVGVSSGWTTILGSGKSRCRAGSGNVERVRVRLVGAAWVADSNGTVAHGDRACRQIP